MTDPQTYTLRAPAGTVVTVTGASRRDTLLKRGYKAVEEAPEPKPKTTRKAKSEDGAE